MRLNGVEHELHPTLEFTPPKNVNLPEISDYVSKLSSAGALLPDESMGEWLRDLVGMPAGESEEI